MGAVCRPRTKSNGGPLEVGLAVGEGFWFSGFSCTAQVFFLPTVIKLTNIAGEAIAPLIPTEDKRRGPGSASGFASTITAPADPVPPRGSLLLLLG